MSTSLTLPCVRFVRQVSGGCARSKYSYQAMQTDLLAALKLAPWRAARCTLEEVSTVTNKVTQTDRVVDGDTGLVVKQSTYTAFLDDRYDAYKQGGDANTTDATMCGYAGMVAYRFTLPSGNNVSISSIKLRLAAARYLRSGLRIAVVGSSAATPSADWAIIRGEASGEIVSPSTPAQDVVGVSSWGFLGQPNAATLMQSLARDGEIEFKASDFASAFSGLHLYAYLWVYVSIEDYEDFWELYEAGTPRYYSIEGSATLTPAACTVVFSGEVSPPADVWETAIGKAYYGAWHFGGTADLAAWDQGECAAADASTYLAAQNAAFGNFLMMRSFEAGVIMDTGGTDEDADMSANLRLCHFGSFLRKDCLSAAVNMSYVADVPWGDVGVFAINPSVLKMVDKTGGSSRKVFANDGGGLTESLGYSLTPCAAINPVTHPQAGAAALRAFAYLALRSTVRIAPNAGGTLPFYTRLKVNGSADPAFTINVWRTSSPDALGYLRIVALAALMSHADLYVATPPRTVSATIKGTGELTQDYTLNATADYLGCIEYAGQEIAVPKVGYGDVLILSPRIGLFPSYDVTQTFTPTSVQLR